MDAAMAEAWGAAPVRLSGMADALSLFDAGAPLRVEQLHGRWRGSGVHTGHGLDGLLEAAGWYGKGFRDDDRAFPLLFGRPDGRLRAVDPAWLPLRALLAIAPRLPRAGVSVLAPLHRVLATSRPSARLRLVEHRNVVTAGMVYDRLPVIDVFRSVAPDHVLGLMESPWLERPFFFALRRE